MALTKRVRALLYAFCLDPYCSPLPTGGDERPRDAEAAAVVPGVRNALRPPEAGAPAAAPAADASKMEKPAAPAAKKHMKKAKKAKADKMAPAAAPAADAPAAK